MSTTNRVNANIWQVVNANANNQPTGLKNLISGNGAPTAANPIYPALYIDSSTGNLYYNLTGAVNSWKAVGTT